VKSRYQFMLDEAQFTIMGFIKGPVCRGQIALNVIEDHFWVWFVDPDAATASNDGEFLATQLRNLELPSSEGSSNLRLLHWIHYAKIEKKYMAAKAAQESAAYPNGRPPTLDMIWTGGGVNQSAALTVFRHFDSATVVKGLVGDEPKTAWVIDYPLLERIHYLLVAGYDVYGNVGLQLFSRLYMDFLRIGGEFNFLYFLPPDARAAALDRWYRGAEKTVEKFVTESQQLFDRETGIAYTGGDPQHELYGHLKERIGPALSQDYNLHRDAVPADLQIELSRLGATLGVAVSWLPELSMLTIDTTQGPMPFTLIHNAGHTNVASMFRERKRRVPEEDTLTVVPGFLGSYPDILQHLSRQSWITETPRQGTVKITHWGIKEAKNLQPSGDNRAPSVKKEINRLLSETRELIRIFEDLSNDASPEHIAKAENIIGEINSAIQKLKTSVQ